MLITSMVYFDDNLTEAQATTTGQETAYALINSLIGRYKFNYTGNTNHYTNWGSGNNPPAIKHIYTDTTLGVNSSSATLSKTDGASSIEKAFLVWETRAKAPTQEVFFVGPGKSAWIKPAYAVNDLRENGGKSYQTMYCMAADVTSLVQQCGYGTYTVANIPYFTLGDGGDTGGGESPGSWQLIVVEQGNDFPVRALSLGMMSRYKQDVPLEASISFANGIKTKASGNVTGQFFFGASCANDYVMTENIAAYNSSGAYVGTAVSNKTPSAGLYRNGALVNSRDYGRSEQNTNYNRGSIRMDLSDVSNIGNNATKIKAYVEHGSWSTFFLLGASVDISTPTFTATQTTSFSNGTVTITGTAKNTSSVANTGAYTGQMKVTLDAALEPVQRTLSVNGVSAATATYEKANGQYTVTFKGGGLDSVMTGDTITYTIVCKVADLSASGYHNSDSFSGYIRSEGVNTGVWADNLSTASSSGKALYKVTLEKGTGIDRVWGDGFSSMKDFINDAYLNILHRAVDASGYSTFGKAMLDSSTENDAVRLVTALATSSEYQNRFSTTGTSYTDTPGINTQNNPYQLVSDCYRMFLRRNAGADEVQFWVTNVWNNRTSTTDGIEKIVSGIGGSKEASMNLPKAFAFDSDTKQVLYDTTDQDTYIKYVQAGKNVTVTASAASGYAFSMWDCTQENLGSTDNPYTFTMPQADIVMTATAVKTYTVSFEPNGGEGTMEDITAAYDTKTPLPANQFTKKGYIFKAWKDSEKGDMYGDEDYIELSSDSGRDHVVLQAQWIPDDGTAYVVNHYTKDLGKDTYSLASSEDKTGATGTVLTVSDLKKEIKGFTYEKAQVGGKDITTATVLADGSLVVDLYYSRNTHTVTLDKGTGIKDVTGAGTYE